MSDIRVNLDRLEAVHLQLASIANEFDSAERFTTTVAEATGHAVLGAAVGTFANWWNVRRDHLTEELRFISESTRAIHDTFIELDTHLTNQVAQINVDEDDA
jgi:uncharacterized protein YukE